MKEEKEEKIRVDLERGEYTYESLTDYLNQTGKIHLTSYAQMQLARKLYVVRLLRPSEVAREVGVDLTTIYHWKTIWGWDEQRRAREEYLYWRATKSLKRHLPDLDLTHSRLGEKLEMLIEQTIDEKLHGGAELKEIKDLSTALKSVVELRRTVAGKATKHKEVQHQGAVLHAHAQLDGQQVEAIGEAITDHLELPLAKLLEESDSEDITDAEFIEIDKDAG